ncbi:MULTISPECIES: arsenate reductase/protein-tyrosine-phosphatase family protein [Oceanimonas]|uniref:Low molecular weight phosphatase family protein n=1 Tax=Oceanimonas smirnovii TaxID=264574 RepID=A0ABW7P0F7_9GAMM|nr:MULTISPECIES: low molecular weight phosphatase family protein [Oceanimonas]MDV2857376.1 low molecular weight phosphatase family protein [Oceanimonas sp. CAM02]
MTSVLFVCHSNSVCSPIAEALLNHLAADRYRVMSAGVQPVAIDANALAALNKLNVDTSGLESKGLDAVADEYFDIVVSLCEQAEAAAGAVPAERFMAWHFTDTPCCSETDASKLTQEIYERIKLLVLVQDRQEKTLW